jgi:hypothetical protein
MGHEHSSNRVCVCVQALGDMSERATSMIEERLRQRSKPTQQKALTGAQVRASALATAAAAVNDVTNNINKTQVLMPAANLASASSVRPAQLTPVKNTYTVEDLDEMEPFKLEMTPPNVHSHVSNPSMKLHTQPALLGTSASPIKKYSVRTSPMLRQQAPASSGSTAEGNTVCVGIFRTIADSMDEYLCLQTEFVSSQQVAASARKCRDYVKLLHSIICKDKEFASIRESDSDRESLDVQLSQSVSLLVDKLVCCIALSFEGSTPTIAPSETQADTVSAALNMDVSLLSLSLATLFAIIKRADTLQALFQASASVEHILQECLYRLVDDRLNNAISADPESPTMSGDGVVQDACRQIINALNTVLLKLCACTEEAGPSSGVILSSLIDVMRVTVLSTAASSTYERLRPISRLIRRVLHEQSNNEHAYTNSLADTKLIVLAIHEYFESCPLISNDEVVDADSDSEGMIAYVTIKTVLSELVRAVGVSGICTMLTQARISSATAVARLAKQMTRQSQDEVLTEELVEGEAATATMEGLEGVPSEVQADIVQLIDLLTSASDKVAVIRRLHAHKQMHPSIDFVAVLAPVSSAFRRFVLDMLDKMDNEGSSTENADTNASMVVPQRSTADISTSSGKLKASDLEVPAIPLYSMSTNTGSASPGMGSLSRSSTQRSVIKDMVRGSLNSLTASLDGFSAASLSVPSVGLNSPIPKQKQDADSQSEEVLPAPPAAAYAAGDADLAARLQRLRAMQAERR